MKMEHVVNYIKHLGMVAVCLAIAGCGGSGKKPSQRIQAIHRATAAVLAQQVNAQVVEGGVVLLVHRQGSAEIAASWEGGITDTLNERFTLTVCGLADLSAEAAGSLEGAPPVAECVQSHADAVAVISGIAVDPSDFSSIPLGDTPMFALEWPFLDAAGPLFSGGQLKAGVFDKETRDLSATPERGASAEEIMSSRYLLAIAENWQDLVGQ